MLRQDVVEIFLWSPQMRKSEHLLPIYHCSTLGIHIYLYLHLKLVACINDNGYFKCLCYPITLIQGKQNTDTINTFLKVF